MNIQLQVLNNNYAIHNIKQINQSFKNTQNQQKNIEMVINSDLCSQCVSLLKTNKYNFLRLCDGFAVQNEFKKTIAEAIVKTIQTFCGDILNIDDLLKTEILKLFIYISQSTNPHNIKQLANYNVIISSKSILMSNCSVQVKAQAISLLSNIMNLSKIEHTIIHSTAEFVSMIKALKVFVNQCKVSQYQNVFQESSQNETFSEIIKFMELADFVKWIANANKNISSTLWFISMLSKIRKCNKDSNSNGDVWMWWVYYLLTTEHINTKNEVNKALCDNNIIREIIKSLKDEIKNISRIFEYFAIHTICDVLRFESLGQDRVQRLKNDGLLFVIMTIFKSDDTFYVLKQDGIQIKTQCIKILHNLITNFSMTQYLFQRTTVIQDVLNLTISNSSNIHYDSLITLICYCILDKNQCESSILNFFRKPIAINVIFNALLSNRIQDTTIKLISAAIRKIHVHKTIMIKIL